MKISKALLKSLIKEIINTTIEESAKFDWEIDGDIVSIFDIELSDGRKVDMEVSIEGGWEDGAFSYEYGSEKGVHRYSTQYGIDDYNIVAVTNSGTKDVIWQFKKGGPSLKEFDPVMAEDLKDAWYSMEKRIEKYMDDHPPEPPEPNYPDREEDL